MAKPLVEVATERLLRLILDRGYDVGDKLPNEYELAEDLEVGRSTVREAVRSLATRNVLEVRQGSGTYVSAKRGVSEDPLGFSLVKDTDKLVEDLFTLRYLLEPWVAQTVAQIASPEEIAELEQLVMAIETSLAVGDPKHLELDVEFHARLAAISGNLAIDSLLPVINRSIHLINSQYTNRQMKDDSVKAHREILQAIQNHDGVKAYEAMQFHILSVKNTAFH